MDDPHDPGGRTAYGITQKTYDAWRTRHGLPVRDVWLITESEKQSIYKTEYWDTIGGDRLPQGVAMVAFDLAVNSGVSRALKALSATQGLSEVDRINAICDYRLKFLKGLQTWSRYGKAWGNRVADVNAVALKMASATSLATKVIVGSVVASAAPAAHQVGLPTFVIVGFLLGVVAAVAYTIWKKRA